MTVNDADADARASGDTSAISLRDAAFGYAGRTRVAGLTLEIEAGSAVALIGRASCRERVSVVV